jgi:DUF4097 and DUF4098 domain-containing protein YvlB
MKVWSILLAVLPAVASCFAGTGLADERETIERVVPLSSGGTVGVENSNGSITVESWSEGSVRIVAEKKARSEEALQDIEVAIDESAGSVRIETIHHRRRGRGSVSYRIWVPAEANVEARTANGAVDVREVTGRVVARSTNGSVKVEDISGDIEATTTNGSIRASYSRVGDGSHRFETVNGSVRVYLPSGASGELDAQTTNGSISTDFPVSVRNTSRRHLRGSFGGGGSRRFEIETVNGSVKLLER